MTCHDVTAWCVPACGGHKIHTVVAGPVALCAQLSTQRSARQAPASVRRAHAQDPRRGGHGQWHCVHRRRRLYRWFALSTLIDSDARHDMLTSAELVSQIRDSSMPETRRHGALVLF